MVLYYYIIIVIIIIIICSCSSSSSSSSSSSGDRGGKVLQIGRVLVQTQPVSLEFFIDIKSFRSHYGPEVDSTSNRNEYQEHFLEVNAAGAQS
jgi:hypothetical protein